MSQVSIKIRNARKLIEDLESNSQRFKPHHNSVCDLKKHLEIIFFRGRCGNCRFTIFATHTNDRVFYLFDAFEKGFVYRGVTDKFIRYNI